MFVVQMRQGSFFYQKIKIVILPPRSVDTKVLFGSAVVLCKTSPPDPDGLSNDRYFLGGWSLLTFHVNYTFYGFREL